VAAVEIEESERRLAFTVGVPNSRGLSPPNALVRSRGFAIPLGVRVESEEGERTLEPGREGSFVRFFSFYCKQDSHIKFQESDYFWGKSYNSHKCSPKSEFM
jgi:hypothetical protein